MISKLSCGVVIYDEIADLKRLSSVLQNELINYQTQWIFVLNHEQSEIRLWIKNWISDQIKNSVCIENPSNNLGYARQLILEVATEDFVYMTDPDVEIKPRSLIELIQLAEGEILKHPESKTIGYGGTLIYRSNNLFLQKTFDFLFKIALIIPFSFQIQQHSHLSTVDHIPSCHLLLNRKLALVIGGFSNLFRNVGEDLEFSHRALIKGYHFVFSPDSEAYHFQNLTLGKWLYRVFSFGQVQVMVQKLHYRQGLRYYRLFPLLGLIVITLLACFYCELALAIALMSVMLGLIIPGFLGFSLTAFTYSLGEIAEAIFPVLEIKNAAQLQAEKLNVTGGIQSSKTEF